MRPSWIQNNRILMKAGTLNVTFTAKHPISKLISSCTTEISVIRKYSRRIRPEGAINFNLTFRFFCRILEGEPPLLDFCPQLQKFKIANNYDSIKAFWIDPKFSDNVRVTEITKTNVR